MEVIEGNLFESTCQTRVNTVNCVGAIGAGIALEFKLRHPAMYKRYTDICLRKQFKIGQLWIYKPPEQESWVLNFPTKDDWRKPSLMRYLERGLSKFMQTYQDRGVESIAFPLLGALNGGLPEDKVLSLMTSYLSDCTIPVEIYRYDPESTDSFFIQFRDYVTERHQDEIAEEIKIPRIVVRRIVDALMEDKINRVSQILKVDGVNYRSLSKVIALMNQEREQKESLPSISLV